MRKHVFQISRVNYLNLFLLIGLAFSISNFACFASIWTVNCHDKIASTKIPYAKIPYTKIPYAKVPKVKNTLSQKLHPISQFFSSIVVLKFLKNFTHLTNPQFVKFSTYSQLKSNI